MRRRHVLRAAMALVVPSAWAQTHYTSPGGDYRLQVPPGWKLETQRDGVSLLRDQAYVSLMSVHGRGAPQGLVEAIAQRVASQWQRFEGASKGEARFGGMPGAYAWFTGVNPRGVEAVLKVNACVAGERGYVLFASAPRSEFARFKPEIERIEAGFELLRAGSRP